MSGGSMTLIDPNKPGAYKMGNVPIGSVVGFSLDEFEDRVDTNTIQWGGGTDIKGYLGGEASDVPPMTNQVSKGVLKDEWTYSFIVDANPRTYTVTVDLERPKMSGPGNIKAPQTTITFTSVAPTVEFTKSDIGTTRVGTYPNPNGGPDVVEVGLYTGSPPFNTSTKTGMQITAKTTTKEFGGQFMFLQTIVPQRYGVDGNGQAFYYKMNGSGPAIDDGFGGKTGYPIFNPQPDPNNPGSNLDNHSWRQAPNSTYSASMGDSPFVTSDLTSMKLQVGNFANGTPESFDTYVMYKPEGSGGTWIGLGKVHWAWSGRTTDGATSSQIPNVPTPSPTSPLSGDAAFPPWTDKATRINSQGFVPYNGGPF